MEINPGSIEFEIPPNEGPSPSGSVIFSKKEYTREELNLGSLEKNAFSQLSEWRIIKRKNYDIAFRIGIKEPFYNNEGKISSLLIIFPEYLFTKDCPMSNEDCNKEEKILQNMLDRIVLEETYSGRRANVTGMLLPPPQYMIEELKEKLR